ncbi:MAG TPA: helix-turn-helix domain-containing protein [Microlunatus sp.]
MLEAVEGVEDRRVALFAALGEPLRLAIVDRLVPGDVSPGELRTELGLATNLLAHHLGVLEQAGVIRRVRSEGDRRRSYLQLRLDEPLVWAACLAGPAAATAVAAAPRIVFVCTGNSARSQFAAASWAAVSAVPAMSAGTHPAPRVHPRAVTIGGRHGLHLEQAVPAAVGAVLREDDVVVAVCDRAHEELEDPASRLHWSIPDPARLDTEAAFEDAYVDIQRRIHHLLTLQEQRRGSRAS